MGSVRTMKRVAYLVLLHLSLSGASFWPLWGSSPQPQPQAKLVQLAELTSVVWEPAPAHDAKGRAAPGGEGGDAWRRDIIVNFFAVSMGDPRLLTNPGWIVPRLKLIPEVLTSSASVGLAEYT
jgi:hypothetical protein